MTSSMLSGERRWASSRRGGMTVLGKVAVPKPINLPSQRLENHGEDPNVEIVPKGTLGWGSKSSSSASNAWGSSSMSPNANRGASSPSHLSARPSSGGSGTRPSSSGSDRALELTTNAWGSNSRPSSSSGALTSSQTLQTSLRPRSAETRSGSSKLSQFADHMTENSVAWNAARTTDQSGITQHKNDGFSLSSGDFPTLGSEKDKSVHNIELQDHDSLIQPASSSGLGNKKHETSAVDDIPVHANSKGETENSWRRDYQAFNEDGMRPGVEKWQGNLPPYPNAGIPPRQFDPWRGAPLNNHQGDVWFRGPPNGPPFANPVAPGGFPIEPFPFYRPNIPPTGLLNPPQVPPPGTGPMGQHKNGEAYRPHIPDAYIPPGMPLRPGFYPGPMAYEGYYGPPLAYRNTNERDVPLLGMAVGPTVYNRYPNQNPLEPGNSQGRSSGCGPAGKPLASELAEPSHAPDTAGQYRVILKQHKEWDGKNEPANWEDSLTTNSSYANVRDQPRVSVQESDHIRNAEIDLRTSVHGKEASSRTSGKQGSSSVSNAKPLESTESLNKFDNISERKIGGASSNTVQIPSRPSAPKDSTLIQKIEGLNAKARENPSTNSKEEQRNKFHSGNRVEDEISGDVVFPKTTPATEVKHQTTRGIGSFGGDNSFGSSSFSGTATSRQITQSMQDRSKDRKGRLNTQDTDGWRKKSGVLDSSSAQLEVSNILVGEHKISVDAYERSGSYSQVRRDGESIQTVSDLADSHAQRAKISNVKESTKQHIKPQQEEGEDEQAKKQKAKTAAKLDELNRRAIEGSMQKKYVGNSSLQNKQEEFQSSESERVMGKSGAANSSIMPSGNGVCNSINTNINRVGKPPILSSETPSETLKNPGKGPVLNRNPSETLYQNVNCADAANALHHTNVASKYKRTSYKQKQNISSEKTSYVTTTSAAPKVEDDTMACINVSSSIATNEVNSSNCSGLPMNSNSMADSSENQKKKNNRNSKSKQKTEETSPLAALPSAIPKEANLSKSSVGFKPQEDIEFDQGSLQSQSLSKDSNQYSGQRYLENEESYGRMNSQLKSQHSRRMPRNMQANRQAEKSRGSDVLMWAPVKSQDKTEIPDESIERTKTEVVISAKCDQQVPNLKNKRAEMERYIPKPVAKEKAQQGSLQQMVSSTSQAPTDGSVESFDSAPQITRHTYLAVERAGSGMESKNRDSRQTRSRQGKAHGSWRQRNSMESIGVRDMEDGGNPGSNSFENVQIPMESQQVQMSETSFLKRQTKHAHDTSIPDGSNNLDNHDSAVQVSVSSIKDLKAINVERQVPFRRQKGTRANHDFDQKKNAGDMGKTEMLHSSTEHNQPDADAVFKENVSIGERLSSHWQPKFQASKNHRGSKPNTKDSSRHVGASFPESYDKESTALMAQPSEKSRGGETPNIENPEAKRERRNAPSKGHPHSHSQVAVGSSEEAPTGTDPRHQQYPSSGVRKNGNQNRFGKGHESPGDWIMPVQDDGRHHNRPTNQDRRGSDRHFHPVGAHGDSTSSGNFERPRDGNYIAGGKYRERGQTNSRRGGGNFSGS